MTSFFVRQRRQKDGSVTYYVVRKEKRAGKWHDVVIESGISSERDAIRIKKRAKETWRDQKHGITAHTPLVDAVLDGYLESIEGKAGWDNAERYARLHVRPALGGIEVGELTRVQVQHLMDAKAKELAPAALRQVVSVLRAAINHAMKRGAIARGDNVATDLDLPRLTRQVRDTLEPHEAEAVLQTIAKHERAVVAFAFYGGFRPGELAALQPEDIDLARRLVRVRRSRVKVRRPPAKGQKKPTMQAFEREQPKDGDERYVPIADPLVPYVKDALEHAKGGKVFPAHRGGRRLLDRKGSEMLRTAMVRAAALGLAPSLVTGWTLKCRRKGCGFREEVETFTDEKRCPRCKFILWPVGHPRRVNFYDMRHTTATLLIDAGVAPAVVTAILGHSRIDFTLQTYVHLKPARLVEAVNKLVTPKQDNDARGVPVASSSKEKP